MRSTILVFATAVMLAGCSMMPAFVDGADKPAADAAPSATTTVTAAEPEIYEIQHTTRGPVRRVKVLLNGRTVDTLSMSKRRTESSTHCCTEDGCEVIDAKKACTTFKMTCSAEGACKRDDAHKPATRL